MFLSHACKTSTKVSINQAYLITRVQECMKGMRSMNNFSIHFEGVHNYCLFVEFNQDRYYRSLLIEPLSVAEVNTECIQELLNNSDRFFYRSVAVNDKHVGYVQSGTRGLL